MDTTIFQILKQLAETKGIDVEFQEFVPPINGLYWSPEDIPPVIWLDTKLSGDELNHVFAHELGHSQLLQSGDGDLIMCKDRAKVMRAKQQADNFGSMLIDGIKMALQLSKQP